jgi:hypothetical protein
MEEPERREPARNAEPPILTEPGMESSVTLHSVRDQQEAEVPVQITAAMNIPAPRHSMIAINEEELQAAYEDSKSGAPTWSTF